MTDFTGLRLDIADQVATITLARPDKMNALSSTLLQEMAAALDEAVARGARALILTGEGRGFCAGADLGEWDGKLPDDLGYLLERDFHPVAERMANLPIPIVTAMNGFAVGAGLSFALAGDIILAARSAYIQLAFVNIGLVPDAGSTWLVAKGAGRTKALEMALLGERMSVEDAVEAGLITRAVDDAELMDEARKIAARFAAMPTMAIRMIRKQVASALGGTLDETLRTEKENQRAAGRTRDFAEGVTAFIEKRPAKFEGH